MADTLIYQEIAARTGGNIYLGVVGPVRTGKSTFIKRIMETMVLPEMTDVYQRERAKDELPQSGSGRSIMTAEPKFVPERAAEIDLGDGAHCSVRMVDSVGFLVRGAVGNLEDGAERMVMTPWYDEEIPMSQAAERNGRVISSTPPSGSSSRPTGASADPREEYEGPEARAAEAVSTGSETLCDPAQTAPSRRAKRRRHSRRSSLRATATACMPVTCTKAHTAGDAGDPPQSALRLSRPQLSGFLVLMDAVRRRRDKERAAHAICAYASAQPARDAAKRSCRAHGLRCLFAARRSRIGGGERRSQHHDRPGTAALLSNDQPRVGFPIQNDCDLMRLLRAVSATEGGV